MSYREKAAPKCVSELGRNTEANKCVEEKTYLEHENSNKIIDLACILN